MVRHREIEAEVSVKSGSTWAAALDQLRAESSDVREEDVARLSLLGFDHINMLGRFVVSSCPTRSPVANSDHRATHRTPMMTAESNFPVPLLPDPQLQDYGDLVAWIRKRDGGMISQFKNLLVSLVTLLHGSAVWAH